MSARLTRSGFRADDDAIVTRAHNAVACLLGHGRPETIVRRLLMLSDALKSTAMRVAQRDFHGEAEAICNDFWRRREAGEREPRDG